MVFHQLCVRVAGSARHTCAGYLPEQRFLRRDVSPLGTCKMKLALLREQHQIGLRRPQKPASPCHFRTMTKHPTDGLI
jgi:hypothetical protein